MLTEEKFLKKTLELKTRIEKSNSVMYSNIRINNVFENKNKNKNQEEN